MGRPRGKQPARPPGFRHPSKSYRHLTGSVASFSGLILVLSLAYTLLPRELIPSSILTFTSSSSSRHPPLPLHPHISLPPNHTSPASPSTLTHISADPENWQQDPHHPRYRLLSALYSYASYLDTATTNLQSKLTHFQTLPEATQHLAPFFPTKATDAVLAATQNGQVAHRIVEHGLATYGVTAAQLRDFASTYPAATNHARVGWALRHLVRDWAASGSSERDATFPAIMGLVERRLVAGRVLVPGACVGRLAADLAGVAHVREVVANEYSFFCTLAGRWVLDRSDGDKDRYSLFPNLENWSNHRATRATLLRAESVPDVVPGRRNVVWREGDFTRVLHGEEGTFQSVVTLFFIDTATDIVEYIRTIYDCLEPGGRWVNLGPVQYASGQVLELSLEEVLRVAESVGFVLEKVDRGSEVWGEEEMRGMGVEERREVERWKGRVKGWEAEYTSHPRSLRHNVYTVVHWVARKP